MVRFKGLCRLKFVGANFLGKHTMWVHEMQMDRCHPLTRQRFSVEPGWHIFRAACTPSWVKNGNYVVPILPSTYSQQINIVLNCMNHCILPRWSCERKHAPQSLLRLTILIPHWLTQFHPSGLTQHWGSSKMLSTVHNDKQTFPKYLSFVATQCQRSFVTKNMLQTCMWSITRFSATTWHTRAVGT